MTADVELLPLPEKSEIDLHLPTGVRVYGYTADDMKTYARSNVAHATAAKDAEIEALRAEVESANGWNERVSVCRDHVSDIVDGPCVICALDAAEARAAKLAEALREELRRWADRKADAIREQVGGLTRGDPEAIAHCDAAIQRINAALDQARGKGVADES